MPQNKKVVTRFVFSVLAVFAGLFLTSCFSSYSGEEIDPNYGRITITVPRGSDARWSGTVPSATVLANVYYVITVWQNDIDIRQVTIPAGLTTASIGSIPIGPTVFVIEATYNGYPFAHASIGHDVTSGHNQVQPQMQRMDMGMVLSVASGGELLFPAASLGATPTDMSLRIFNYAASPTDTIGISISGPFGLFPAGPTIASIASDDYHEAVIAPNPSLLVGTHTGTVTLTPTSPNIDNVTFDLSFTVTLGSGTVSDPFQIWNEADLRRVGRETGPDAWTLAAHYRLMANIALTGGIWIPIPGTISSPFSGSFDGNGFTLSGLTGSGIFSAVSGTIQNLSVSGTVTATLGSAGGIATRLTSSGRIENSSFAGTFTSTSGYNVGGLVSISNGTIINSSFTGTINAPNTGQVGGLVGSLSGAGALIVNSFASGAISGADVVGGLVGGTNGSTVIRNSFADVAVTGSGGSIIGDVRGVGGLVGFNVSTITDSYATGNVTGGADRVGGLVGWNIGAITNSFAMGDVTSTNTAVTVGGLVGRMSGIGTAGSRSITNSVALSNSVSGVGVNVGRVRGDDAGTVTNTFANDAMTGHASNSDLDGFDVALTATQNQFWWENTVNFNFGNTDSDPWVWYVPLQRPRLHWQ